MAIFTLSTYSPNYFAIWFIFSLQMLLLVLLFKRWPRQTRPELWRIFAMSYYVAEISASTIMNLLQLHYFSLWPGPHYGALSHASRREVWMLLIISARPSANLFTTRVQSFRERPAALFWGPARRLTSLGCWSLLIPLILKQSIKVDLDELFFFSREIESSIEHMSNLRRDKWVIEGKIRKWVHVL